jgi:beta-glucosidase
VNDFDFHDTEASAWREKEDELALFQTQSRVLVAPSSAAAHSASAAVATKFPRRKLPRADAEARARDVLARLSPGQKYQLLRGTHYGESGWYVGNVIGILEEGVPFIKMQDAGNGFRPTEVSNFGTTTAWPCMLAMASTWDRSAVSEVASAIAREFRGKGANTILGPSVNVHRVARNGRNFEYLSGEDPYLGAELTKVFISGVQAEGVMATIKHYAFNEQETNRMTQSSIVDRRTAWELYYPPFAAAVEVGVGAFMCSYNKVNGTYACGNRDILLQDLQQTMGFTGIIMSDWFATHGSDFVSLGLNMEMPGIVQPSADMPATAHFTDDNLSREDPAAVDASVLRVLTTIYQLGLDQEPGCTPPCLTELASNQTDDAHRELARSVATSAVILLKNANGILPLDPAAVRTLAVVGPAANVGAESFYYVGGGSGFVPPSFVVTPLDGISQRAATAGIAVVTPSSMTEEALAGVDVVIVVAATTSAEGADRASLSLDGDADSLISQAAALRPTVVLMQTPGAVLTPWRNEAAAILNVFLAGQETAAAWAAVLFGDVSPEGKLPIMLPQTEADTIAPGDGEDVPYSEGLFTSYRSNTFQNTFPFGHGFSYTTFDYGALERVLDGCSKEVCVGLDVTNSGTRSGSEVVQAYVHFGQAAEPTPEIMLRGFYKTRVLQPGEVEHVLFNFTGRDLSLYEGGAWVRQAAEGVELRVGASSGDIRQTLSNL